MSVVLVTGASGFIGRPAVSALLGAGHEVHAVARERPADAADAAHWHEADLLDPAQAAALVAAVAPTHLLHLAWYAVPGRFWTAPENAAWVGATLGLLAAFAAAGGRRAVAAGTCAEYEWGAEVLVERETPLRPATLYGACKHATHVAAAALARELGIELAWGRVFHLYGPREHPDRLVSSVARGLLAGERVPTTEGAQVCDFMHVDDVGAAFAALLGSGGVEGPVNVATGVGTPVRTLVAAIADAVGRPELVDYGALPTRPGQPERIVASVARLTEEVGFTPARTLEQGVEDTLGWWRERL